MFCSAAQGLQTALEKRMRLTARPGLRSGFHLVAASRSGPGSSSASSGPIPTGGYDLVDRWCETVLIELRAAAYPEPPCSPVGEVEAARVLKRLREPGAELAGKNA